MALEEATVAEVLTEEEVQVEAEVRAEEAEALSELKGPIQSSVSACKQ